MIIRILHQLPITLPEFPQEMSGRGGGVQLRGTFHSRAIDSIEGFVECFFLFGFHIPFGHFSIVEGRILLFHGTISFLKERMNEVIDETFAISGSGNGRHAVFDAAIIARECRRKFVHQWILVAAAAHDLFTGFLRREFAGESISINGVFDPEIELPFD